MRASKKILSMILALVMLLGLLPATASATGDNNVYISVSFDGKYINDKDGGYIAYVPVSFDELASIDLDAYGLSDYKYDEDGDGTYDITALQLVIYAHENLYGGSWSDVTFTGAPGSSYFQGGIFGFDENLNYYLNGEYPLASAGWGATSDQIVLEAGDFIDLASFSSWDFYQDSAYGFHLFADANGQLTHQYTVEEGTACDIKLLLGTKDWEYNSVLVDVAGYEVFYGTNLYEETGSVTTDDSGCASITFPAAGSYYLWVDGGYGNEYPEAIVSAPGYAQVTVTAMPAPEQPRQPQDVSAVLDATMAQLATTVTAPAFGTNAGEWTVFSLARGGFYAKDNAYFADYYERIVETVNTTATSVNMNGALHKNKSTENSRLIVALSAIGKDASAVGDWDLVEAYSANGFSWIKKQGLNGTIWALIALDSNNYETSDTTIRQQCVDAILAAQHDDGGWALQANLTYDSDPDVTGMALVALYPYRNQPEVAAACQEAFACLSAMQHDNGTFASGGSECSESCAWVIVATTTWGINPDTDSRFVKNGKSVVDGLLAHYLEESAQFQHIIGAGANGMATDQSCYALVAYDRFMSNQTALYDYSDVTFDPVTPDDNEGAETPDTPVTPPVTDNFSAALGLPIIIEHLPGTTFNGVVSINGWNKDAGYKLIDLVVTVPEGLAVEDVVASDRLSGGDLEYHFSEDSGKLRIVYLDVNANKTLEISGTSFPADLFTITFRVRYAVIGNPFDIAVSEMSLKVSDAEDSASVVKTESAKGSVMVLPGMTFSATEVYRGDGVDLIPANKKAVVITITTLPTDGSKNVVFNDASHEIVFKFNAEITEKLGVAAYMALVDTSITLAELEMTENYVVTDGESAQVNFGDVNGDSMINAQDALATVNAWLRKGESLTQHQLLTANVNGDAHVNTYDVLGIVEAFVYQNKEYAVVTKATKNFGK